MSETPPPVPSSRPPPIPSIDTTLFEPLSDEDADDSSASQDLVAVRSIFIIIIAVGFIVFILFYFY
jgi:hypothetical protein